jgi:hypothetical protein
MIVSVVAGAELVALVAVGVLVLGKGWFARASVAAAKTPAAHHVRPAARPAPRVKPVAPAKPRPMLSRARTTLLVLNGNGQNGAAGAEASALRAHGYPVRAVGNASRNDYAASIVMYLPGMKREALRLARDAGLPIVAPLDGLQPSQLHGAKLAVIVGR